MLSRGQKIFNLLKNSERDGDNNYCELGKLTSPFQDTEDCLLNNIERNELVVALHEKENQTGQLHLNATETEESLLKNNERDEEVADLHAKECQIGPLHLNATGTAVFSM
ncbi:uncharacterized protein LOC120351089 [Nilaparvata lugens]|uniref:uncharacterized protein LOC120351089 n=1 Tax=Nilaparvata lugens TaxID=108931 RepID=UPI00193E128F|nr:uncharacterized protein LOC120351089 [Nilaparvata lugens]